MPITLFLAGQAFELEAIEAMSAAFVAACDALHLSAIDNRLDQSGTAKGFGNLLRGKLAA